MIYVRVRHLPRTSALAIDANGGRYPWTLTDHLLADIWFVGRQQVAGKKARDHPGRPHAVSKSEVSPDRRRKLRDARRRAAAEQAARNRRAADG
jgi:hypothetical protein